LLPFATLYIILGISLYTGLQQHLKKRYEKKI
jgi:hypothetical protein